MANKKAQNCSHICDNFEPFLSPLNNSFLSKPPLRSSLVEQLKEDEGKVYIYLNGSPRQVACCQHSTKSIFMVNRYKTPETVVIADGYRAATQAFLH